MKRWIYALLAVTVLLAAVFVGSALMLSDQYRERVLPGVTVQGIDLGGLTPAEAAHALARGLPDPAQQTVTLTAGERTWQLTWADVGRGYDVAMTAQAAYAVGRGRSGLARLWRSLRPVAVDVPPVEVPADPAQVTAFLAGIAPELAVDPRDATLTVTEDGLRPTSGEAGRRLDVPRAAERVVAALAADAAAVDLTAALVAVPPQRPEPEPALSAARALLATPFTLVVEDPLTGELPEGYRATFAAPPARMRRWLVPRLTPETIRLTFDVAAVRAWLTEVAPELGPARELDLDATLARTLAALGAGEHQAAARVVHPPSTYTVQPGDTFSLIAYEHRFPQWHLERVNPGVEPGLIDVGQVITIPSIDALFPHPLVPGKRIEVDLPTQQLRAYEDGKLAFEFKVSSGMSSTPTIAGQFQVLFKEENAFAQRWHLDMPYFMGIYEEDEGFYNGFHELPITSYGVRLSAGVLGWPASYGCIILDEGDAETLYRWAPVGTLVRISGFAPGTPTWQETLADIAPPVDAGESP
jgi:lipoprotein-anchoring transpeptidase ErfK/SrfK